MINWGILSTAHINRRLIPAFDESDRGQLVAVASRHLVKAKDYATTWNIPRSFGSYSALLAEQDIQAIYISLPNHLHTEWIIKSLEAGKHVLCEKPLCLSIQESDRIIEAAHRTGLCVMEGYMHLYHPQTALWKTIIDAGEIGELHQMKSCFSFQLNRDEENYRWNKSSGGGALWDVGVYPLSLFQYILDQSPESGEAYRHLIDGIDHADTVSLAYADGLTGQFFVSFRSDYNTETVFLGNIGQLTISHPFNAVDQCKAYLQKGNKTELLDLPAQYLYRGEVEAMHDYILSGKIPHADLKFSRSVLETILMLKGK